MLRGAGGLRLSPVLLRPHHGNGTGGDKAVNTMTTTTTTTKASTPKTTGADIAAQVAKEVDTLKAAFASLETALQGIGPIGLDSLAAEMGKTVNEKGRPEFNTWVRFTLAVCQQKPSFTRQQSLFGIARGAARDKLVAEIGELKGKEAVNKFAKTTTKASQDGTTCKLVLARPAAWDIAFE